MATTHRLDEGWKLTDGILSAFPLPGAAPVAEALLERGHLRGLEVGYGCRAAEWISLRTWTYTTTFEVPEEDERTVLWFERLAGRGEVRVNGACAAAFSGGVLSVDVTGLLTPSENVLEVRFDPSPRAMPIAADGLGNPIAEIGLCGPVWLVTANYVALRSMQVKTGERSATASIRIEAYTAGKYIFQYALSDDDGMVGSLDFIERLPAAERTLLHELPFVDVKPFSPGRRRYELKLTVTRSGVGCEAVRVPILFKADVPTRLLIDLETPNAVHATLTDRVEALGADGVLADRSESVSLPHTDAAPTDHVSSSLPRVGRRGWAAELPRGEAEGVTRLCFPAMPSPERLEELAGGELHWPPVCPLWLQRGSLAPDLADFEAAFGPAVLSDPARFAALSRLLQAERTLDVALRARIEGRAVAAELSECFPQFCSPALVEWGDRPRPAYWALMGAWRPVVGFVLPPEGGFAPAGASMKLPVYLASDAQAEGMVSATASAYAMDGSLLAGVTFPASAHGVQKLGELALSLPTRETAVLLRVELHPADGGPVTTTDTLLAVQAGPYPFSALLNPPRTAVTTREGAAFNAGNAAALMASGEGFGYGVLLPGESRPAPAGVEWLNRMR